MTINYVGAAIKEFSNNYFNFQDTINLVHRENRQSRIIPVTDRDDIQFLFDPPSDPNSIGHWICVYYRYTANKVYIYDSLNPSRVISDHERIICDLYPNINKNTDIVIKELKRTQQNAVACGVYACVCAISLTLNRDPSEINFKICYEYGENEEKYLRLHLLQIVENMRLVLFPEQ